MFNLGGTVSTIPDQILPRILFSNLILNIEITYSAEQKKK